MPDHLANVCGLARYLITRQRLVLTCLLEPVVAYQSYITCCLIPRDMLLGVADDGRFTDVTAAAEIQNPAV